MGEVKTSAFPHVLKEYNPDYEPRLPSSGSRHKCDIHQSPSHAVPARQKSQVSQRSTSRGPVTPKPIESPTRTDSPGQRTLGRKPRKSDAERHLELSQKWDQAKQEVRLEDHEHLREKITLQHELIRVQDQYAEQRRLQIAQAQSQQREVAKAKKLAQETALQQICRQSLEEDKRESKSAKKAAKANKDLPLGKKLESSSGSPLSPVKSPLSPGFKQGATFKAVPTKSASPDGRADDTELAEIPKDVPWHEQQLYKMYGKSADYFLHPKIEQQPQVKKTVNPKLRRQGGRAGAEALWTTLRHDSSTRLLKEDANIPQDLKESYGSFARQSLQQNRIPVRRMFYAEDDVPEMDRLMDWSIVQNVRKKQHKTDIMYRASVTNQDRTEVLKFNNPMPEFGESKAESIDQYLPSWMDNESEGSVPEYYRWVGQTQSARERPVAELGAGEKEGIPKGTTQSLDEDLILILSRKRQAANNPKYVFLSEKDATVPGEFTQKFADHREEKDIPRPYKGDHPKAFSSMGMSDSLAHKSETPTVCYSAPPPRRQQDLLNNYTSGWEPLSMHALVEYKKQLNTGGEGDFNLGRTKMWVPRIPVV